MSQQKFFDFSKIIGEEMEVLLTRLKSLISAKKITDNLPDNFNKEVDEINYKIEKINEISKIDFFDGGEYEHIHIWGKYAPYDEENCIRTCEYGDSEIKTHRWDYAYQTPTHTSVGYQQHICSDCGYEIFKEIPKISAHTWVNYDYIDDIYHRKSCECGAARIEEHTWDDGVVKVEPTTTTTGVLAYTCAGCGASKTEEIPIIFPEKDTLGNMSWEDISIVSKAGKASEYWSVGDQKTITIDDEDYLVEIIDFDHDDVSDIKAYGRAKAGITFQLYNLIDESYSINSYMGTDVGWHNCDMRTVVMPSLYNRLNTDLKNVIINVNKKTGITVNNTSGEISTTEDNLFLLSLIEIYGSNINTTNNLITVEDEGSVYDYYRTGIKYKKVIKNFVSVSNGGAAYWLRSPSSSTNEWAFGSQSYSGFFASHNSYNRAPSVFGTLFAFCV